MKTKYLIALAALGFGMACAPRGAEPVGLVPACPHQAPAEALPMPSASDSMKGGRIVGTITTNPWHAIKNGGVVFIENAPKQPGVGMSASVDNHDMAFVPYISVVTAGGTVTFGNTDPLIHNVFSPDGEKWDLGSLPQNGALSKKFETPGTYTLLCNLHQSMVGYIVVSPSSYFARTTGDGKFAIAGVPAGTYKVTAWAPRLNPSSQTVTVPATGDVVANFSLP